MKKSLNTPLSSSEIEYECEYIAFILDLDPSAALTIINNELKESGNAKMIIYTLAHELRRIWQQNNGYPQSEIDLKAFAYCYLKKYHGEELIFDDETAKEIAAASEKINLVVPFKKMRKHAGLRISKISKYLNIPRRSIENWEAEIRLPPDYVLELIEYKLKNEGLI